MMRFFQINLVLFFVLMVSVSGLEVLQESYLAGETVQAYVETDSLSSSNIVLLDGNGTSINISPLFTEYREGFYFIYFNLPLTVDVGNYTLFVNGVQENFVVEEATGAVLQVKPGFVILEKTDDTFFLQLTEMNFGGASVLVSASDALRPRKSVINFASGENKDLYVDYNYGEINSDLAMNLSYASQVYFIPVFYPDLIIEEDVIEENNSEINFTEEFTEENEEEIPFVFLITKKEVEQNLSYNESIYGDLKLQNTVNRTLSLRYSLTGNLGEVLEFNQTEVFIASDEIYSQRIWFNRGNNSQVGSYKGEIVVSDGNYNDTISVSVDILDNKEIETVIVEENISSDIGEEIPLVYNGETLGEEEKKGNGVYIIGISLIVLLIILIVLVALKLRQREDRRFSEYIEETKKKK